MKTKITCQLILAAGIAFLSSYLLTILLLFISYYLHEFGHILFGFIYNLRLDGTISKYNISNWVTFQPFPFVNVPQQTQILSGKDSLFMAFGGMITVVCCMFMISYVIYRKYEIKNKLIFLIPVFFAITGIIGNIVCGTDNIHKSPYPICDQFIILQSLPSNLVYLLMAILFFIIFPIVYEKLPLWRKNLQKEKA